MYHYFAPCRHVIGVLFLLQKRLREEAVGDATDSYAQRMLLISVI